MTLLVEAPVATETPAPVRRGRGLLVLAGALALAGVLGSLLSLAPKTASLAPVTPEVTGAPFVTVAEFGAQGSYVLGYEHDRAVTLSLPVRNEGRLPIRITSADIPGGKVPLLDITSADGLPLSLGPGDTARLTLHGVLGNCRWYHERAMETYSGVTLGIRSLGWPGSLQVAFDRPVLVKSPMLASCPDRKLDRQADRRSLLG